MLAGPKQQQKQCLLFRKRTTIIIMITRKHFSLSRHSSAGVQSYGELKVFIFPLPTFRCTAAKVLLGTHTNICLFTYVAPRKIKRPVPAPLRLPLGGLSRKSPASGLQHQQKNLWWWMVGETCRAIDLEPRILTMTTPGLIAIIHEPICSFINALSPPWIMASELLTSRREWCLESGCGTRCTQREGLWRLSKIYEAPLL